MKLGYCLVGFAASKAITQVLEDLTEIATRFNVMTVERSDRFPDNPDLFDALVSYQTDILEVENNAADLKRALARGADLNLQVILSTIV